MKIKSQVFNIAAFAGGSDRPSINYVAVYPTLCAAVATNGHMAIMVHTMESPHAFLEASADLDPVLVPVDDWAAIVKGAWPKNKDRTIYLEFNDGSVFVTDTTCRFDKTFHLADDGHKFPDLAQVWPNKPSGLVELRDSRRFGTKLLKTVMEYAIKAGGDSIDISLVEDTMAPCSYDFQTCGYTANIVVMPMRK